MGLSPQVTRTASCNSGLPRLVNGEHRCASNCRGCCDTGALQRCPPLPAATMQRTRAAQPQTVHSSSPAQLLRLVWVTVLIVLRSFTAHTDRADVGLQQMNSYLQPGQQQAVWVGGGGQRHRQLQRVAHWRPTHWQPTQQPQQPQQGSHQKMLFSDDLIQKPRSAP